MSIHLILNNDIMTIWGGGTLSALIRGFHGQAFSFFQDVVWHLILCCSITYVTSLAMSWNFVSIHFLQNEYVVMVCDEIFLCLHLEKKNIQIWLNIFPHFGRWYHNEIMCISRKIEMLRIAYRIRCTMCVPIAPLHKYPPLNAEKYKP